MLADNHRLTPTQLIADLTNCQLKYMIVKANLILCGFVMAAIR